MQNRIKELRNEKGLTVRELEQITGISHSHITRMENGKRSGTIQQYSLLAKVFNVSIDYLCCHSDIKNYDSTKKTVK